MKKVFLLILLSLIVSPASAHTSLVNSWPSTGEILEVAPNEVRLEFNEALLLLGDKNPNQIEVKNSEGLILSGVTQVSENEVFTDLSNVGLAGEITVSYRVTSSDGHPVIGEYRFTVNAPDVIASPTDLGPVGEEGSNLLIRLVWVLLVLSGIGILALLRLR